LGDGVFQLLPGQQPSAVLARDYIATFKLLPLYDIDRAGCARLPAERPECRDAVGGGCRMAWSRMRCAPDSMI
jgi:hypothetical protein